MSSISGPTPSGEFPKGVPHLVHPEKPVTDELLLPSAFDYERAKGEFLRNPDLTIPSKGMHEETHARVASTVDKITGFAKEHPYLTGLYALGVIVLLCAFPAIADSLARHSGITIGHAHLAVGLSVGIVCLYYGISLMNMAKRAALKDVLETQIKEQNQLQKELLKRPTKKSYLTLESAAKQKIQAMESYYETKSAHLREEKQVIEKQLAAAHSKLSEFSTVQQEILVTLKVQKPDLSPASEQVSAGATLALVDSVLEFPEGLSLPDDITPHQEENQTKMERLFNALDTFPKEHPTATLIGMSGLGIVVLSGVMLHYLITGTSTVEVIGVVSDVTVVQVLVYGICLIYEGYNRADIEKQKKELKRIEEEAQNSRAFADAVKLQKETLVEKFDTVIATFQDSLQKQYVVERDRNQKLIKECGDAFFALLNGIGTPPTDPEDVESVLLNVVDAAAG